MCSAAPSGSLLPPCLVHPDSRPAWPPACARTSPHREQEAVDIDGKSRSLSEYAGKVTLVVNVASACGYTDENYKGERE